MKTARAILCLLAISAIISGCSNKISPGPYITINGQTVTVEIADTEELRAKGLSGHAPLNEGQGMLFVFPDKTPRTFWMKDMRFGLDIIWIEDSTITKISSNIPPEGSEPKSLYRADAPVNFVLEVPAGWAIKHNIKAGDKINYHL